MHTPGRAIIGVCQHTTLASNADGRAKSTAGHDVLPATDAAQPNGASATLARRDNKMCAGLPTAWPVTQTMRLAASESGEPATSTRLALLGEGVSTGSPLEMSHENTCGLSTAEMEVTVSTAKHLSRHDSAPTILEDSIISCLDSQAESTPPPTSSSPAEGATNVRGKPTPGPWKVHGSYLEGYPGKRQAIYSSEMEYVAICDAVLAGSSDDEKNDANARLIASAPALLEALEVAVATEAARCRAWRMPETTEWLAPARSAIAEAKGE